MFQTQNRGGRLPTTTTSDIKITADAACPSTGAPAATDNLADKDNNEDSNSNSEELGAENCSNKETSLERSVFFFHKTLSKIVNVLNKCHF